MTDTYSAGNSPIGWSTGKHLHILDHRVAQQLEQRGILERTPTDVGRHLFVLSLTPSGLELQQTIRLRLITSQDRVMAHLSDSERDTLRELLARVIKANEVKKTDQEK